MMSVLKFTKSVLQWLPFTGALKRRVNWALARRS